MPGWFGSFPFGYRLAWKAMLALPLVMIGVFAIEMAQHVAEVHIGMYDSIAQAEALEKHPLRMGFGYTKMLVLLLAAYAVIRFAATGDPRRAMTGDGWRTFMPYLLVQVGLIILQEWLVPKDSLWPFLSAFLASQVIGIMMAAWAVAASLGNPAIGPWHSIRVMAPQIFPAFAFSFLFMLPPMVLHYGFAAVALVGPDMLLWPGLILDSLLVAYLAAILPIGVWIIAERAAQRANVDLMA